MDGLVPRCAMGATGSCLEGSIADRASGRSGDLKPRNSLIHRADRIFSSSVNGGIEMNDAANDPEAEKRELTPEDQAEVSGGTTEFEPPDPC